MKENDFLVASLQNPNFNSGVFRAAGMNLDNTQMLTRDEYLKSNFIRNNDAFKDITGTFSEDKFNQFYYDKLKDWNSFAQIEDYHQYDLFDYRRFSDPKARIKDVGLSMYEELNPEDVSIGKGWINTPVQSSFSNRERAQTQKIFDTKTNEFLDYSPNDHALFTNPVAWFKDLFNEPLVLAQYDEDGDFINPFTKQMERHKKGDLKVNENGQYYYETLNGRNLHGKQVLSGWDTLTVDGTEINKLDFFDSDDREKSIGGMLMKNALSIAPLFFSGPVGTIYMFLLTTRELLKTLPMIDGLFAAVPNQDTSFTRLANNIAGWATSATQGVSDYGANSFMNLESISNLMTEVALQWGQQKMIARSIQKLGGFDDIMNGARQSAHELYLTNSKVFEQNAMKTITSLEDAKEIEKANQLRMSLKKAIGTPDTWDKSEMGLAYINQYLMPLQNKMQEINRLGADASLAYMALVSNTDVYSDMLERGLTKREALAVTLGSTLGMFAVDRKGLGEVFFSELTSNGERAIRATLKNNRSEWLNSLKSRGAKLPKGFNKEDFSTFKQYFLAGKELGKEMYDTFWDDIKHHSGGFFVKATGEGIEEVSEELMADLSKQLYELASDIKPVNDFFGGLTTDNVNAFDDFSNNPSKALKQIAARYGMNFFGGFLGGGLFYGVERFQNKDWKRNTDEDKLIYILRNNKKQDVLKVLDEYREKGQLGSKKISAQFEEDEDGNLVFLGADENHISQNDFIYNQMRMEIETVDSIIRDAGLDLSDGQLYDQMTLSEMRFQRLRDAVGDAEYQTGYIQRYNQLVDDYVKIQREINSELNRTDIQDGDTEKKRLQQEKVDELTKQKQDKLKEIEDFKSGENAIDYMGKMLFVMNKELSTPFYTPTLDAWLWTEKHMSLSDYDAETSDRKEQLQKEYALYKQNSQLVDSEKAWANYKFFGEQIRPKLVGVQDRVKQLRETLKTINDWLSPDKNPITTAKEYKAEDFSEDAEDPDLLLSYDDELDNETQEEYLLRDIQEGEDEETFQERRKKRYEKLQEQQARRKNIQSQLDALDQVKQIIQNSGGVLDAQSRRKLLLNLDVRRKDIIQDILKYSSLKEIEPSINEQIDEELQKIDSIEQLGESYNNIIKLIQAKRLSDITSSLQDKINELKLFADLFRKTDLNFTEEDIEKFLGEIYDWQSSRDSEFVTKVGSKEKFILENYQEKLDYFNSLGYGEQMIKYLQLDKFRVVPYDEILDNLNYFNSYKINDIIKSETSSVFDAESGTSYNETTYSINEDALLKNSETQNMHRDTEDKVKQNIAIIESEISGNKLYSAIEEIYKAKPIDNPIIDIVNSLALALHRDVPNIESFLNMLLDKMMSESKQDFVLSEQQRDTLQEIYDLLQMSLAYIVSAHNSSNLVNPFPHNQLVNQMIDQHHLKLEKMPVVDDDIAQLYDQQIKNLITEIGIEMPDHTYNIGSWRWWDLQNAVNKSKMFIDADKVFTNVKDLFWTTYRSSFKNVHVTKKDGTTGIYDLLDGIDSIIEQDKDKRVHLIEDLFYKNIHKIMEETGKSFSDIMKDPALKNIISSNNEALIQQSTAELDKNLTLSSLTPMDRGIYLTTVACISSTDFYTALVTGKTIKNQSIAPLGIQQYVSRVGMALVNDTTIFYDGIRWIYECVNYEPVYQYNRNIRGDKTRMPEPFILYSAFLSGNGGAGKTEVVLRNTVDFLLSKDGVDKNNIWYAAPKPDQIQKLKDITQSDKAFDPKKLCVQLIGEQAYATLETNQFEKDIKDISGVSFVADTDGSNLAVCDEKIAFINTEHPKAIIIDEATHFSTMQLSIISNYCKKQNIPLILIGDNFQEGYRNSQGYEYNLNPENVFTARAPRISVTLRDSNYQKYYNVQQLVSIIKKLNNIPLNQQRNVLIEQALQEFEKLKITSYQKSEFNGDIITDDLNQAILEKIRTNIRDEKSGNDRKTTIGYLGTSSSTNYQILKDKFGDQLQMIDNETEIQGQEFDYVVIDVPWAKLSKNTPNQKAASALNFAKRFYTLSTRSKIASVFIDDGNLSKIIKTEIQQYKNTQTNFGKKEKEDFKKYFDEKIQKFDIDPNTTKNQSQDTPSSESNNEPVVSGHAEIDDDDDYYNFDDLVEDDDKIAESELSTLDNTETVETEERQPINMPTHEKQALVYGESHMLGLETRGENRSWVVPPKSQSHVLRDIEVFAQPLAKDNEEVIISDGVTKDDLVKKLLAFKNLFLFRIAWGSDQFNNINRKYNISKIIDKDSFEKSQYKLVVAKKDPKKHTFVGYSDLVYDKADINGETDKAVYSIVVQFKTKDGKDAMVTLGQLADPNTFEESKSKEAIRKGLKYKRDLLSHNSIEYEQLNQILEKFDNYHEQQVKEYRNHLNIAKSKWLSSGLDEVVLPIRSIDFDKTTVIRNLRNALWKQKDNGEIPFEEIQKMRLDILGDDTSRKNSFRNRNRYLVISPIYIYKGNSDNSLKQMSGLSGRAVIFVSRNLGLRPDQLLSEWAKNRDVIGDKSVRMIRLDNAGVTLGDLCDKEYEHIFRTKANNQNSRGYNKFPFETRVMGKRMLVALHNFRANLLIFQQALQNEDLDKTDPQKLDSVLKDLHVAYQEYLESNPDTITEQSFRDFFRSKNYNDQTLVDKIWKFNDDCDKKHIRQFRLGTGNDNDWQIRMFEVNPTNGTYTENEIKRANLSKKNNINFIFTNINGLYNMIDIMESLYNILQPLGIQIRNKQDNTIYKEADRINITDHVAISLNKTNDRGDILYGIEDYSKENYLTKFLPLIITRIAATARAFYQIDPETGMLPPYKDLPSRYWDWGNSSSIFIKTYKKAENETGERELDQKFELNIRPIVEKYSGLLVQVLDLCFHGTSNTKNLIDSKLYGKQQTKTTNGAKINYQSKVEPQSTDALFKDGFFIDPFIEIEGFDNALDIGEGRFIRCQQSQSPMFLVKAAIDMPRFWINFVDDYSAQSTQKEKQQTVVEQHTQQQETEDEVFKNLGIDTQVSKLQNGHIIYLKELKQILKNELNVDVENKQELNNIAYERSDDNIAIYYATVKLIIDPKTYAIKTKSINLSVNIDPEELKKSIKEQMNKILHDTYDYNLGLLEQVQENFDWIKEIEEIIDTYINEGKASQIQTAIVTLINNKFKQRTDLLDDEDFDLGGLKNITKKINDLTINCG